MEWSQPREAAMQRDYRLLKEGMSGHFHNYKAHLNAVLFLNVPGYKRYKFVNYLHNDEDIIPIQYIDWSRAQPVLSNRALDVFLDGKLNLFCLEPQHGVELYTFDGRFYKMQWVIAVSGITCPSWVNKFRCCLQMSQILICMVNF